MDVTKNNATFRSSRLGPRSHRVMGRGPAGRKVERAKGVAGDTRRAYASGRSTRDFASRERRIPPANSWLVNLSPLRPARPSGPAGRPAAHEYAPPSSRSIPDWSASLSLLRPGPEPAATRPAGSRPGALRALEGRGPGGPVQRYVGSGLPSPVPRSTAMRRSPAAGSIGAGPPCPSMRIRVVGPPPRRSIVTGATAQCRPGS